MTTKTTLRIFLVVLVVFVVPVGIDACASPRDDVDLVDAGFAGRGGGDVDAPPGGAGGSTGVDGAAAAGDAATPGPDALPPPDGPPTPAGTDAAPAPDTAPSCPTPVVRLPAARKVVTTSSDTCALLGDGTVRCWGRELVAMGAHVPTPVPGLTGVTDLAAGAGHACAVLGGGTVRCWGRNDSGQLGDGTTSQGAVRTSPVMVAGLARVASVAAGGGHTCAVITDGSLRCWGANNFGQLGDGTMTPSPVPVTATTTSGVVAVATGDAHTCVVVQDGSVACWGTQRLMPVVGITQATQLAASGANSCVLASAGFVWCWTGAPILVSNLSDVVWVSTGGFWSCAVAKDGGVRCWGMNPSGQLGDGTTNDSPTPVTVVGLAGATAVSTSPGGHTCALTTAGAVRCWGANDHGQLGDCTTKGSLTPVVVEGW